MIPCGKTELQIFNQSTVQVCIDRAGWSKVYPTNPVVGENPIEFILNPLDSAYYDLNDTSLYLRCKLSTTGDCAPINNLLGSLFEDVQISLNDKVIDGGDYLYPYKSFITNKLNYGREAEKSWLTASGYYEDTPTLHESPENVGHQRRKKLMNSEKSFELMGPICSGMFQQSKYIIPKTAIKIKLTRAKKEFFLMYFPTANNKISEIKFEILEAWLRVRTVVVNPEVMRAHHEGLKEFNAIYPIQQCQLLSFTLGKGVYTESKPILTNNECPKLIILSMVSNLAFHGSFKHNPFNLQHFNCNSINVTLDRQVFEPIKMNFEDGEYMNAYMSLFQNLEEYCKSDVNSVISQDQFLHGSTLFAFNLTPDLSYQAKQQFKQANLRLDINFSKPLSDSINIILYMIFDGQIELTNTGRTLLS